MKASLQSPMPPTQKMESAFLIPRWLLTILICELGLLVFVALMVIFCAMGNVPIRW